MPHVTLSEYVSEALEHATYQYCEDTQSWCAWVHELPGCWSQADTAEEARRELGEVIEGWLVLGLQRGDPIPSLNGRTVGRMAAREAASSVTG